MADASVYLGAPKQVSELERIATRITKAAMDLDEIANKLREHADAVHGSFPETGESGSTADVRLGQLGAILDTLDRLDRAISGVAVQAGRNCTLA